MALVVKRARSPTGDAEGALIESKKPKSDALSVGAVPRTSSMQSPIMVLTGHGGEVCCCLTLNFAFTGALRAVHATIAMARATASCAVGT